MLRALDPRIKTGRGIFIRDVLLQFDLPQVAAAVADRKLTMFSPLDAMKRPAELSDGHEAYEWTAAAYRSVAAADSFRIALQTRAGFGGGKADIDSDW